MDVRSPCTQVVMVAPAAENNKQNAQRAPKAVHQELAADFRWNAATVRVGVCGISSVTLKTEGKKDGGPTHVGRNSPLCKSRNGI